MPDERVAEAVALLDTALAAAPKRDGASLSRAVVLLSALRDEMAARDGRRTPESRDRLVRLNGILSAILAVHFPLGDPPWEELRNAKTWLGELEGTAPQDRQAALT
ncbi:hypothetical protein [Lichenicola sp.]|uniref:hypothetical protein n=1 Tax=Lichenicola sp. TaxID=2804529 RepID=UPI003B00AD86